LVCGFGLCDSACAAVWDWAAVIRRRMGFGNAASGAGLVASSEEEPDEKSAHDGCDTCSADGDAGDGSGADFAAAAADAAAVRGAAF
jgi:hypothetical protein